MVDNEQKEIISKYISEPDRAEDIKKGDFYAAVYDIDDYATDKLDYFGGMVIPFIEVLVKAGLSDNIKLDDNTITIKMPESKFDGAILEVYAGDGNAQDLIMGRNPFNYELDEDDLLDWVLSSYTLKKIYDFDNRKWTIPESALNDIIAECSRAFSVDVYEYWQNIISYTLYEDGGAFDEAGVKVDINNNVATLTLSLDRFLKLLERYEQFLDKDSESIYNLHASADFIIAILKEQKVEPLHEPYAGWGDEVEFDTSYGDDIVEDVLKRL